MLAEGCVHPLDEKSHPSDAALDRDDLELRVPLQRAGEDEARDRLGHHRLVDGDVDHQLLPQAARQWQRAEVEVDGEVHVFEHIPERLVAGVGVGLVAGGGVRVRGDCRDEHAAQAEVGTAFRLLDGEVEVPDRDLADADQPRGRMAAELGEPVVVDLHHREAQAAVLRRHLDAAAIAAAEQHLCVDTVEVHVLEPGSRIPASLAPVLLGLRERLDVLLPHASAGREQVHALLLALEDDHLVVAARLHARSLVAELLRETFGVDRGRWIDVIVGREDALVGHGGLPGSSQSTRRPPRRTSERRTPDRIGCARRPDMDTGRQRWISDSRAGAR